MRPFLTLTFLCAWLQAIPQHPKTGQAARIAEPPRIDGILNETLWEDAQPIGSFTQYRPDFDKAASQATTVKILYNNNALYIGAVMHDTAADSILAQLGRRDEFNLNADDFYFKIDPYSNNQDAYLFGVNAAGVQFDSKISDATFDAVWNSAVSITPDGWVAEIEIPYSAIRFPKTSVHSWGMQCSRTIRRIRESDQWSLVPLTATNEQLHWGILRGIENINSPLRLSFTPYVATTFNRQPVVPSAEKSEYQNSFSWNTGADIKYGIDNRFTLDMILLPDFGQVQSDKKIKNLSYTEVVFDENRTFFKEAVELFSKGDLFYSRRIGKEPSGFHSVYDQVGEEETVDKNPSQVKLINAFKISGRSDGGLGVGILNAITNHTYAEVSDNNGNKRKILTEPLTNYNIVVLDQQLRNNSSFYLINTHTNRDKGYDDANVTGTGFSFSNKKNSFVITGDAALSQRFSKTETKNTFTNTVGYKYALGAGKKGGWIQYGVEREEVNNEFNTTDLGYFIIPGYIRYAAYADIQQYKRRGFLRESFHDIDAYVSTNFLTGDVRNNEFLFNSFFNMMDYNSFFFGAGFTPLESYDYLEARTDGRKFRTLKYYYYYGGISTDYRKKLAVDITLTNAGNFDEFTRLPFFEGNIAFRIRINDHMFIKTYSEYGVDHASIGFAYKEDARPIFGMRRLDTYENVVGIDYIFKNDMILNVSGRHYWITGEYKHFYDLMQDGELKQLDFINADHNFSSNYFNVDVLYEWRFTRGSVLNIIYKNAIEHEKLLSSRRFGKNLDSLLHAPQSTTFSVKILYYLDYLTLKKRGIRQQNDERN